MKRQKASELMLRHEAKFLDEMNDNPYFSSIWLSAHPSILRAMQRLEARGVIIVRNLGYPSYLVELNRKERK